MAKCPSSKECGIKDLRLGVGESIEIEIDNVSRDSLCIYNLYTDLNKTLPKSKF